MHKDRHVAWIADILTSSKEDNGYHGAVTGSVPEKEWLHLIWMSYSLYNDFIELQFSNEKADNRETIQTNFNPTF